MQDKKPKRGKKEEETDEEAGGRRHHDLLMAALRSAVVGSEMLSRQDVLSLSLTNKEVVIAGGAKVLTVFHRFPSARDLRVSFYPYLTQLIPSQDPDNELSEKSPSWKYYP